MIFLRPLVTICFSFAWLQSAAAGSLALSRTPPIFTTIEANRRALVHDVMVGGKDLADDPLKTASGFLVSIEARANRDATVFKQCLGAAIATDAILTAGHCLADMNHVTVKFIESAAPLVIEKVEAKDWSVHPKYNGGYPEPMYSGLMPSEAENYHDIAVILLSRPSSVAVPITVVPPDYDPARKRDKEPVFYVFGHARNEIYIPQHKLQFTTATDMKAIKGTRHWFTSRTEGGVPLCGGDSGSPVTVSAKDQFVPGRDIHYLVGLQTSVDGNSMRPERLEEALAYWKSERNLPVCGVDFSFVSVQEHREWLHEQLAVMDPENPRRLYTWGGDRAGEDVTAVTVRAPAALHSSEVKDFPSCMRGRELVYTDLDGKCLGFSALEHGERFRYEGRTLTYDAHHPGTFKDWVAAQISTQSDSEPARGTATSYPGCRSWLRLIYTDRNGECLEASRLKDGITFYYKGKPVTYDAAFAGSFQDMVKSQLERANREEAERAQRASREAEFSSRTFEVDADGFPNCIEGGIVLFSTMAGDCLNFKQLRHGDRFAYGRKTYVYDSNHPGTFVDWVRNQYSRLPE